MTSLLANFFRQNVTLNMGATDEKSPQTLYPPPKKIPRYLADEDRKASVVAGNIDRTWKVSRLDMPYDKPEYYGPSKSDKLPDMLLKCPFCEKQYYLIADRTKCEHWNGMTWTKNSDKKENSRFGYQFKEEWEKQFPNDPYPYNGAPPPESSTGPSLLKDALKNSWRGRVVSGNGRITSGFDWE